MYISTINNSSYVLNASTNIFIIPIINNLTKTITIQNTIVSAAQRIQNLSLVSINQDNNPTITITR